ncbi:MAG: hypothetical protein IKR40_01620 [Treponema sp.]|nr:hypothetical protein [Treponema sp.]
MFGNKKIFLTATCFVLAMAVSGCREKEKQKEETAAVNEAAEKNDAETSQKDFPTTLPENWSSLDGKITFYLNTEPGQPIALYDLLSNSGSYFAKGTCYYSEQETPCLTLEPPYSRSTTINEDMQPLLDYMFPNNENCNIVFDRDYCELEKKGAYVFKDSVFFNKAYTQTLPDNSDTKIQGIPAVYLGKTFMPYTPKTKTFVYEKPDTKSKKIAPRNFRWSDYITEKGVKWIEPKSKCPWYRGMKISYLAKTAEKSTVNGVEDYWYYFEDNTVCGWVFGGDIKSWEWADENECADYLIESGVKDGLIELEEIDLSKYQDKVESLSIDEEGASVVYISDDAVYFAYPYKKIFAKYARSSIKADSDGFVKFTYGPEKDQQYLFILGEQIHQYFSHFQNDGKLEYNDDEVDEFGYGRYHDQFFKSITASSSFSETLNGRKVEYTPANLTRCFEIGCKCHPYWWNYAHIPWVEGAAGNGIGESVSVEFTKEMAGMSVLNGYTSLDKLKLYKENARVKEISLEDLINGDKWTVTFDDYVYFNYIEFPKKTTKIKMTINSVYEGTKYQDTCVSAILPSPESPRSYADSDYEDFKEMIKSCEEVLPEDLLSISPY